MRRTHFQKLATILAIAAACDSKGEPSGSATETTNAAADDMTGGTTSGDATAAATAPAATTAEAPTTGAAEPVGYCHGFQLGAEAPFLSLYILGGEELADGTLWPIECSPEGEWMFGLYPSLGGWDPMMDEVTLAVEVDVAGHNIGPAGHFFSADVGYYVGCDAMHGGALGVAPVKPPVEPSDLAQLDGLAAEVRVTVLAGGTELAVEATVTLSAPGDLLLMGCTSGLKG